MDYSGLSESIIGSLGDELYLSLVIRFDAMANSHDDSGFSRNKASLWTRCNSIKHAGLILIGPA